MKRARTSITMEPTLRQRLEDMSASSGLPMSTIVSLAVRKMQSDLAFFGVPTDYRSPVDQKDTSGNYRRRRPRRDLKETA